MPYKPAKPCCQAGCPALTHDRFCEAHAREREQRYDRDRGSSTARGYGSRWRRLRAMFLRRHPICQDEAGCREPATDVDHIVPRAEGGTDDWANLQALCHSHHSRKTATRDGGFTGRGGRAGG